jgi:hypothetical protein
VFRRSDQSQFDDASQTFELRRATGAFLRPFEFFSFAHAVVFEFTAMRVAATASVRCFELAHCPIEKYAGHVQIKRGNVWDGRRGCAIELCVALLAPFVCACSSSSSDGDGRSTRYRVLAACPATSSEYRDLPPRRHRAIHFAC